MEAKQEKVKKPKKKNKKLLLQIGLVTIIYSVLALLVVCALLYVVTLYIYVSVKEEQLEDTLERVAQKTFEDEYSARLSDRFLECLKEHPEAMWLAFEDSYWDETEAHNRFYDFCESWEGKSGTAEFMEALPEDLRIFAASEMYWDIFYTLLLENDEYKYKQMMLLDYPMEDGASEARILFSADDTETDGIRHIFEDDGTWVKSYMERHNIGSIYSGNDQKETYMTNAVDYGEENTTFTVNWSESANESITGYYTVFEGTNDRIVLMIKYSWAEFQDQVKKNTSILMHLALGVVIISEALLLVFVYLIAVRPLRKVKRSLSHYIETKDGDVVVREMQDVKLRNEFGLLADDISAMVQEIDRYTRENMEMAGEQEKAATELELAAKIQTGMLRRDFPATAEYEIYALMDPAKEVGGDFYDYFEVDATHMALVIADVAGKGVPGALFMMSALSVIRDKTQAGMTPADILSEVNNELVKGDFGDMFVTVWLGILDLESGVITAANAGHEYPILKTGEEFELLKDKHGFVVGGMEGMKFQNYEIDLGEGGTLFVYTDGLPEATAADETLYGTDRILESLNRAPDEEPKQLVERAKTTVDIFVGEAEQFDDLTILCLRYRGKATGKDG